MMVDRYYDTFMDDGDGNPEWLMVRVKLTMDASIPNKDIKVAVRANRDEYGNLIEVLGIQSLTSRHDESRIEY